MPNKDNKSGGRNIGISDKPNLERLVPDKGKDGSDTNETLPGIEISEIDDPKMLDDENVYTLNNVGGDEEEDDDDDDDEEADDYDDDEDDDDDDLEDIEDAAEEGMDDISNIDDEDLDDDDDDDDDIDDVDEKEINEEDVRGLNPGAFLKGDTGNEKSE